MRGVLTGSARLAQPLIGLHRGCLFGDLFVLYIPHIAGEVSRGLAGAIYGVIMLLVIFVMPSGAAGFMRMAVAMA
jgi:branched-chain amino acid transport system permease protein